MTRFYIKYKGKFVKANGVNVGDLDPISTTDDAKLAYSATTSLMATTIAHHWVASQYCTLADLEVVQYDEAAKDKYEDAELIAAGYLTPRQAKAILIAASALRAWREGTDTYKEAEDTVINMYQVYPWK